MHEATLHDYRLSDARNDVRGSEIYGRNDEKIGTIDDVILDHATGVVRYAVVNAGGWFTGHRYLITAGMIEPSPQRELRGFFVDMSREQVRRLPRFDEDVMKSEQSWKRYEEQHKKAYTDAGGVLHRAKAPDRIITPPHTEEETGEVLREGGEGTPAAGGDDDYVPDVTPRRMVPPLAPPRGGVGTMPIEPGVVEPISSRSRWDDFQDNLVRDLSGIRNRCDKCGEEHQRQRKAG
jgi:hypothetical protein